MTESMRYTVALAVCTFPQTTAAPSAVKSSPEPSTVTVSYTHLTLPTNREV